MHSLYMINFHSLEDAITSGPLGEDKTCYSFDISKSVIRKVEKNS